MKSLKTLIKLKQREIDVIRREIGILQEQKSRHERKIEEHSEELKREISLAAEMADMSGFFGNYSEAIKQKRRDLKNQIKKLDLKMDVLAEKVREHFSEQKKYEIALEEEIKREKKKIEKREQAFMDEVAARQHALRQGDNA